MTVGIITAIYRYPVKSMGGEQLDQVQLTAQGIVGDRAWALRDEERGALTSAKKIPALMSCQARYESEPPSTGSGPATMTLPDGSRLATDDSEVHAKLSAALDKHVTIWPLQPADALDHYRREAMAPEERLAERRRLLGRRDDEPLPDLSGFPAELAEYSSPLGTYFDAYPLLFITTATLRHFSQIAPEHRFDIRRFRPNFVVDIGSDQPFAEREWLGRRVAIGNDAVARAQQECPRCIMVTHGFDDLPKDPKVLRAIVQEASGNLGIYADVGQPGTVRVGDSLELA